MHIHHCKIIPSRFRCIVCAPLYPRLGKRSPSEWYTHTKKYTYPLQPQHIPPAIHYTKHLHANQNKCAANQFVLVNFELSPKQFHFIHRIRYLRDRKHFWAMFPLQLSADLCRLSYTSSHLSTFSNSGCFCALFATSLPRRGRENDTFLQSVAEIPLWRQCTHNFSIMYRAAIE